MAGWVDGWVDGWLEVCGLDDIPRLGSRRVARPAGMPVAVFRNAEDEVFAVLDRCPHKGGPLSQGIVFGRSVACPLHNWTIELDNACARAPDTGCVPKFACRLDAGRIYLDAAELATLAIDLPPPRAGAGASTGAVGDQTFDVQAPHSP